MEEGLGADVVTGVEVVAGVVVTGRFVVVEVGPGLVQAVKSKPKTRIRISGTYLLFIFSLLRIFS